MKHPLAEKIVIVPGYSTGRQLLQSYTKLGFSTLNLKMETITDAAEKLTKAYMQRHELELIPSVLAKHFILSSFEKAKQNGQLVYFNELEVTPGVIRSIYNAIRELKNTGLTSKDLKEEAFINHGKAKDMQLLFSAYETALIENHYLDEADILRLAIEQQRAATNNNTIYFAIQQVKSRPLELELLEALVKKEDYMLSLVPEADQELRINPKLNTTMFHANGEHNEVKEVIRHIKQHQLPLDQVTILYTTPDPYTQLFHELSHYHELSFTFETGTSILNTVPAKLFHGLLLWIKNQYRVIDLIRLLQQGHLRQFDETSPSTAKTIRLLRDAEISWGIENYQPLLEQQISKLTERIESIENKEDSYQYKKLQEYIWLNNWIIELTSELPNTELNEKVNYAQLANKLSSILTAHCPDKDPLDKAAKAKIQEELRIINKVDEEKTLDECLLLFSSVTESMKVSASAPNPGAIHVTSYKQGIWAERPYTFLVGLDFQRFPGQLREDPILLDMERKKLDARLPLKNEVPKDTKALMNQLISSMEGNLFLSYSAYNPMENREVHPSSFLLELYRKQTNEPFAHYQDLLKQLGEMKGYIPEDTMLDEPEWWLDQLLVKQHGHITKPLFEAYQHLAKGTTAREQKESDRFTSYDGKISGELTQLDPRKNSELILSSSSLELLGKCPYAYFLKYVLKIEEPAEQELNPGQWLTPAQRGSLLHRVFELFYRQLTELREKPSMKKHEQLLMQIVEDCLLDQKRALPPANELVYSYERAELHQSSKVFLAAEEEHGEEGEPIYFEFAFGTRGKPGDKKEPTKAIPISLPSGGEFFIRGFIDRIDRMLNGNYLILDYKTGSTYSYDENGYIKGGRQLQHTLYALALEYIFKNEGIDERAKVEKSGYYFPTVKGEGQRVMRRQDQRESFLQAIENLLDIIAHGHFTVTDDTDDCKFCEYKTICDRHIYPDSFQVMQADEEAEGIKKLGRVRAND